MQLRTAEAARHLIRSPTVTSSRASRRRAEGAIMTAVENMTSLRQHREETVKQHVDGENRHDIEATIATFHRPRYEVNGEPQRGRTGRPRVAAGPDARLARSACRDRQA